MAGTPHRIGIIDVGVLRGNESYLAVKARKAIQSLVESVDDDFDPPLSTRKSSIHLDFSDTSGSMDEYIDDLLDNEAILAFVDGRIAGILFYRTDYHVVKIHKSGLYVVVILVGKEYRGMKLASKLYTAVEERARMLDKSIYLRTWAGNKTQEAILPKRGYQLAKRIENDRGPGRDTVYYEKPAKAL